MAALFTALLPGTTETCIANGDTRTIYLFHSHTKETIAATYRVGGQYDSAALEKLNWFLRDWRTDDRTKMDPRLFDVVWETYRNAGGNSPEDPVVVVSAYRSPRTNAMLRRRSRAVAEHSQHMLGKAMDTTMPNMSMEKVREVGMKLQRGGVGYYGNANFVHLDVGSVRAWPRMSYDQLARLFPDGKTVHLAADGRTLARYDEARAEIEATGGIAQDAPSRGRGFFAFLFGGGRDEEDDAASEAAPPPRRGWAGNRTQVGAAASRGAPMQVASAGGEDGDRNLFVAKAYRGEAPRQIQDAERNLPRGETYMSPPPGPQASPRVATLEAKEPVADDSGRESAPNAALPLPPRRPGELTTASIPLPPIRPVQLATVPRAVAAYAANTSLDGVAAIRSVLDATQGAREARKPELPNVITEGGAKSASAVSQSVALAYAPAGGATPGLRAVALGRQYLSKEAIGRTVDFVPARLDRSNFRALTGSAPLVQTTTQSVLGPAVAAPRAAARAELNLLAAAPSVGYVTGFGRIATDLPTNRFAPRAMNLARATIN